MAYVNYCYIEKKVLTDREYSIYQQVFVFGLVCPATPYNLANFIDQVNLAKINWE